MNRFALLVLFTLNSLVLLAQSKQVTPSSTARPADTRQLLSAIFTEDQTKRQDYAKVENQYGWGSKEAQDARRDINQMNSRQLKTVDSLITAQGYPGRTKVGQPLNQVAFMVIQQSNSRVEQEKYLPVIEEAARNNELDRASAAFLIDQVKVQKGEKQVYGTQIRINNAGQRMLYPIENETDINRLRKEMDLEPLDAYLKRMGVNR